MVKRFLRLAELAVWCLGLLIGLYRLAQGLLLLPSDDPLMDGVSAVAMGLLLWNLGRLRFRRKGDSDR